MAAEDQSALEDIEQRIAEYSKAIQAVDASMSTVSMWKRAPMSTELATLRARRQALVVEANRIRAQNGVPAIPYPEDATAPTVVAPRHTARRVILIVFGLIIVLYAVGHIPTAGLPPMPTPVATYPLSAYQDVDIRVLKKSAEAYQGKPIKLSGTVLGISEKGGRTGLQIWVQVPGGSDFDKEAVQVSYEGTLPGVYEKTAIVVYGIGAGMMSGKNAYGATIEEPAVDAVVVTR